MKVKKTKTKKAKRYDEAEKVKLLNDYQELRNKGKNADVAAKEIGVPYITLRTWQKAKEVKPKGKKRGRPAKAAARGAKPTKGKKVKNDCNEKKGSILCSAFHELLVYSKNALQSSKKCSG